MTIRYRDILLAAGLLGFVIPTCMFFGGHRFLTYTEYHERLNRTTHCSCHTCLSDDHPWFEERFNKSMDPFLTRKNKFSGDAYKWWKSLQYDYTKVPYEVAVEDLFNFFPNNMDFMDSSPQRCRTCAVVGNSGNLVKSHYGALIDTHDVVIRMNGARVKGYEADVGNKTTIHMMYPESAVDLEENTHLVFVGFKVTDLQWLLSAFTTGHIKSTYQAVKAKIKANKDLVSVLHPAFMKYVRDRWLGKRGVQPSTGFMALTLSLHICDEVNVFGFGADKDGNWHHYWEKLLNKNLKTGVHAGSYEYKVIVELSDKQKINFFRGW